MSKLYLIRHGNTFSLGEKAVWVGRNEDLPLSPSGIAQAQKLKAAFDDRGIVIEKLLSSPLRRAVETAEKLAMEIEESPLLNEIDYGTWGGKSTEELRTLGYDLALERWEDYGQVPDEAGWGSTAEQLKVQIENARELFIRYLARYQTVVAVTSNGFLKCFARECLQEYQDLCLSKQLKVRTGHLCELQYAAETWKVVSWGIRSEEITR
ncbi:MAG: histidine phosphatase family protein [Bdellovibrionales bacterium]|nr:histidine phosphatase family protein [Bdellovibrionales bacterium]